MISTGYTRTVDCHGRVLIPKEVVGNLYGKDIDMFVEETLICIRVVDKDEKYLGFPKRIDSNGRIVIPSEIRNMLNLKYKDKVEILRFSNNTGIVLRKFIVQCPLCCTNVDLIQIGNFKICLKCIKRIKYFLDGGAKNYL